MTIWDVIIVGAGPAGSSLAIHLCRAGKRVLLLDKRRFPRPKPCGGLLSPLALKMAPLPLTPCFRATPSLVTEIDASGQTSLHQETTALVRRLEMDHWLLQQAIAAGATLLTIRGLRKITQGESVRLTLSDRRMLLARVLVGADGAASSVRRLIGEERKSPGFAIEREVPLHKPPREMLFDYHSVKGGYAWYFPMSGSVNAGIAKFDGERPDPDALDAWIAAHFGADVDAAKAVGAPILTCQYGFLPGKDRVLLIGDAAGLADDLTGEGLSHAFASARFAAAALLDHPEHPLALYSQLLTRHCVAHLHQRIGHANALYLGDFG